MSSSTPPDAPRLSAPLLDAADPDLGARQNGPLPMQATPGQIARAVEDWSRLAGEPVRVEQGGPFLYAFGSELACLRLYYRFRGHGRLQHRPDLQLWIFSPLGPGEAP